MTNGGNFFPLALFVSDNGPQIFKSKCFDVSKGFTPAFCSWQIDEYGEYANDVKPLCGKGTIQLVVPTKACIRTGSYKRLGFTPKPLEELFHAFSPFFRIVIPFATCF